MNKFKLALFSTVLFSSSLYMLPTYAGQEACDGDSIHCLYSADPVNATYGNYVKITWPELGNLAVKACMNYGDAADIEGDDVDSHHVPVGTNNWKIQVCSDASYSNCQDIAADKFTISKKLDGTYTAEPKYTPISLAGHYPAVVCHENAPRLFH